MWYAPTVTTPPASDAEPITVDMVKAQCRIDADDDSALVQRLCKAARAHVEKRTGTTLPVQTIDAKCDNFCDLERPPFAPISSVASVKYFDTDNTEQTLSTDIYELRQLDAITPSIVLKYGQVWPTRRFGSLITVRAVVGFAAVPDDLAHAMLTLISHWYDNRGDDAAASVIPPVVGDLLSNHCRFI